MKTIKQKQKIEQILNFALMIIGFFGLLLSLP
jgi:hypothetical protein